MKSSTLDAPLGQMPADQAAADASVAGNARLTALTGMTLLMLFTAEIVTVILGVSSVLTAHVAIGLALMPVVLLKVGSTGWRFVKYYRGDRAYVRRGRPRPICGSWARCSSRLPWSWWPAGCSPSPDRTGCTAPR